MKDSIEMSNIVAIHLLFTSLVDETSKDCLQSPSHLRHLIVFLVVLEKRHKRHHPGSAGNCIIPKFFKNIH